jgi:isopenicillin-N N-acyltransferase like protein
LLRAVLDSTGGKEAAATVRNAPRANSANYLIVDDSGYIVDLETAPTTGGTRTLRPRGGVLAHANHFLSSGLTGLDRYLERKPHSLDRLASMNDALAGPGPLTLEALQGALADHRNAPLSICQHPNPDVAAAERTCTLAGVTLDVTNRRMMVAAGPPCTAPWADVVLGRHG